MQEKFSAEKKPKAMQKPEEQFKHEKESKEEEEFYKGQPAEGLEKGRKKIDQIVSEYTKEYVEGKYKEY